MRDLFDLSMPWWAFALRGAVCYIGLLFLLRLTGKRSFGDMSPFDIVVLIVVGGTLRSAIVGKDSSLLGPMIAVTSILLLDKALAFIASRNAVFAQLLEGRSILLARNGSRDAKALRQHNIPTSAFDRELRAHGVSSVAAVREARLESNGRVTVLKYDGRSQHTR